MLAHALFFKLASLSASEPLLNAH